MAQPTILVSVQPLGCSLSTGTLKLVLSTLPGQYSEKLARVFQSEPYNNFAMYPKTYLIEVETERHVRAARELFEEYEKTLGIDLCFQNFEKELADLPGAYQSPKGRLIVAMHDEKLAGCVALRKIEDGICEMKRLYVRPDFRGAGVGRLLAESLIEIAREIGYERMRLDTLPGKMDRAIAMYRRLGFKEIEPYYFNPVKEAAFMELDLGQRSEEGGKG